MQKMASEDITHITPTQVRFQNNKSVESFQNFSFVSGFQHQISAIRWFQT